MHELLAREVATAQTLIPEWEALPLLAGLQPERAHAQFPHWWASIQKLQLRPRDGWLQRTELRAEGEADGEALFSLLQDLKPWRKGFFHLFGIEVDSEWRSELKYQRLRQLLQPRGRRILDVGCGNGYYMRRLLQDGAAAVLGVDPSWHCFAQYLLLQRCFPSPQSAFLPCTLDDFPLRPAFDAVLSMGVFYHRRDPLQHLLQLKQTLAAGGLLLLETLVVEGDEHHLLLPPERYAGMKNVYFLPSPALLKRFVERCGFVVEALSEAVPTTTAEQRKTPWLDSLSLESFLQADGRRTIEGHPPPRRCMLLARKA